VRQQKEVCRNTGNREAGAGNSTRGTENPEQLRALLYEGGHRIAAGGHLHRKVADLIADLLDPLPELAAEARCVGVRYRKIRCGRDSGGLTRCELVIALLQLAEDAGALLLG